MVQYTQYLGIILCILLAIFSLAIPHVIHNYSYTVPDFIESIFKVPNEPHNLLFVGDIMLGRNVETLINQHGVEYPFEEVREILSNPTVTIGNFEGIVSKEHVHAPGMTFQFSIKEDYLTYLKTIGFDMLSLANNHSNDYGYESLQHTRSICTVLAIVCAGTPDTIDEYSLAIKNLNGTRVGILFLNTIYKEPDYVRMNEVLDALSSETDIQISYVHWGEEYALTHLEEQEMLAHMMIDAGADAVIGHHPHVVQDIEIYNEKPIFYSLGNFIFDQYFSEDVQEGLGVELVITDKTLTYTLIPFFSKREPSQPYVASSIESEALRTRLSEPLLSLENFNAVSGTLTFQKK